MLGINFTQALIPSLIRFSTLGSAGLTVGRCAVAAAVLLAFARRRGLRLRGGRAWIATLACGVLLGAHWMLFIEAVKRTTVAVAMVSLYTFPVMISVLEPVVDRRRPAARQVLAALAALAGVALMQRAEGWNGAALAGGALAAVSAACFAVRTIVTRRLVRGLDGGLLMGWQAAVAGLAVLPFLGPWTVPAPRELGLVLLFGTLFSAWPHAAMVRAMAHLPAAGVAILTTLQVPLSVCVARVWPGEPLRPGTLLGLALVLGAVLAESLAHWREPVRVR